jgi:hypothetical protein
VLFRIVRKTLAMMRLREKQPACDNGWMKWGAVLALVVCATLVSNADAEPPVPKPLPREATESCIATGRAYDLVASLVETVFARIRGEVAADASELDATIRQLDAICTASVTEAAAKIAGADAKVATARQAEADAAAACAALTPSTPVQALSALASAITATQDDLPTACSNELALARALEDAVAERRAIEGIIRAKKETCYDEKRALVGQRAVLAREDAALASERAAEIAEIGREKTRALAACDAQQRGRLATNTLVTRVCGKSAGDRAASTVVLVGPTAAAARGMTALEQHGVPHRAAVAPLLSGPADSRLAAIRSAQTQAVGKPLVLEAATAAVSKTDGRLARAQRAFLLRALDLEPRVVLLRVDKLGKFERNVAAVRHWRVAEDNDDGVRAAVCAP